jgi:hypothetical protein
MWLLNWTPGSTLSQKSTRSLMLSRQWMLRQIATGSTLRSTPRSSPTRGTRSTPAMMPPPSSTQRLSANQLVPYQQLGVPRGLDNMSMMAAVVSSGIAALDYDRTLQSIRA